MKSTGYRGYWLRSTALRDIPRTPSPGLSAALHAIPTWKCKLGLHQVCMHLMLKTPPFDPGAPYNESHSGVLLRPLNRPGKFADPFFDRNCIGGGQRLSGTCASGDPRSPPYVPCAHVIATPASASPRSSIQTESIQSPLFQSYMWHPMSTVLNGRQGPGA